MSSCYVPRVYTPRNVIAMSGRSFGERRYFLSEVAIVNNSNVPVYIVQRDGVVHFIPPVVVIGRDKDLVIQKMTGTESVNRDIIEDPDRVIFDCNGHIVGNCPPTTYRSRLNTVTSESYRNFVRHGKVSGIKTGVEFRMNTADIRGFDVPVYIHELDMVIARAEGDIDPELLLHPSSPRAETLESLRRSEVSVTYANFLSSVEIVDNDDHIGKRWLNMSGHVFCVEPIKDPHRDNGVYYTHTPKEGGPFNVNDLVSVHFPIDADNPPLDLWRKRDEAEAFGDPKIVIERRIREENETLRREKTEMERGKLAAEKEILELRQSIERERVEKEAEKFRREEEKSNRDEKNAKASFVRKMFDHWAWFTGAVFGVVTAALKLAAAKAAA